MSTALRVVGRALAALLALLPMLAGLVWWAARALEPLPAPPRGGVFERVTLVEPSGERRGDVHLRIPHLRDGFWSADVGFNPARCMAPADFEVVERSLARTKQTVARLDAEGIPLHTGSDANAPNIVPGASLHRELALLAGTGACARSAAGSEAATTSRRAARSDVSAPGRSPRARGPGSRDRRARR